MLAVYLFLRRECDFGHLIGYTVNNVTLAAVIILMGVVVDDAIIVAENIERKMVLGANRFRARSKGAMRSL